MEFVVVYSDTDGMRFVHQKPLNSEKLALWAALLFLFIYPTLVYGQTSFNGGGVNGGAVVVGQSTNTCNGTMLGGVRWNTTNSCMEICNGTIWNCIQLGVCSTNLPNSFTINNQASVAVNTLISSNIAQITGIGSCVVEISVAGQGSPEFRVCNDATCTTFSQDWTSAKSSVTNNQYVQMRLTSSISGNVTFIPTLTVGSRSVGWSVSTTGNCSDASPPVGTFCADGSVYIGLSPDGGVKMYTTPCRQGRTWGGASCSGTAITLPWSNTDTIDHGLSSTFTGESNTNTLATTSDADAPYGPVTTCYNLVFGGQTDWYLPTSGEAQIIQAACGYIPDLTSCGDSTYHYTSRENSATQAHVWRSNNASIIPTSKLGSYPFRCVRKD